MKRLPVTIPLTALLLTLALGAPCSLAASATEPEQTRASLDRLVQLGGVLGTGDSQRLTHVRQQLTELSPEQLAHVEQAIAQSFPEWHAVPRALERLASSEPLGSTVAAASVAAAEGDELEVFRRDYLTFIAELRRFTSLFPERGTDERLAKLAAYVAQAPPEHLPRLREELSERTPAWQSGLRARRPGAAPSEDLRAVAGADHFSACGCHCGDLDLGCWIGCGICAVDEALDLVGDIADLITDFFPELTEIFTGLTDLPQDILDFFTGEVFGTALSLAFDSLFSGFLADIPFLELVDPTDPDGASDIFEEVLELVGFDPTDPDLLSVVASAADLFEIACPEIGEVLDPFAVHEDCDADPSLCAVGGPRAEYGCKQGIGWLTSVTFDLAPDDVFTSPFKLGVAIFHFPVDYLCLCVEAQSTIAFDDAQAEHRDLLEQKLVTEDRLDAQLGTRASQTSADNVQSGLNSLRTSIAGVDGQVSDVQDDLATIQGKADDLLAREREQSEFLEAFQDLVKRLDIEEDLLGNGSRTVAAYSTPDGLGGLLGLVRDVVTDTIAMNQEAGQPVFNALDNLARGDQEASRGQYDRAYDLYRQAYRDAVKPQGN